MGKKIYSSFEELLKGNHTFLKLFEKNVPIGILRALWELRQTEVDHFREEVRILGRNIEEMKVELKKESALRGEASLVNEGLEKELALMKGASSEREELIKKLENESARGEEERLGQAEIIEGLENELAGRKETARQREGNIKDLEERLSLLQTELERRERELEKAKGDGEELVRVKEEVRRLSAEGDKWKEACRNLEDVLVEKCNQLEEGSRQSQRLERELASVRSYVRTQKSINERMSGELLRLTGERGVSPDRGMGGVAEGV